MAEERHGRRRALCRNSPTQGAPIRFQRPPPKDVASGVILDWRPRRRSALTMELCRAGPRLFVR